MKSKKESIETFGFPTLAKPPYCKELKPFTEDLLALVAEVEFRPYSNSLQQKMKEDLKSLAASENQVVVSSDKTGNYYFMDAAEYQEGLEREIRKNYSKADQEKF